MGTKKTTEEVGSTFSSFTRISTKMRATIVCVLAFMLAYSEGAAVETEGRMPSPEGPERRSAEVTKTQEMEDQAETKLAAAQAKLFHKKNQAQVKANHVAQESIVTSKIVRCNLDTDCPGAQQCVNYAPKLSALSKSAHASVEQSAALYWKTKAYIKRCKDTSFPKMQIETIEEQIQFQMIMDKSITTIKESFAKWSERGVNMTLPANVDKIDQITMESAKYYNEITGNVETPEGDIPMVRTADVTVSGGLDMNTFLLISLLDKDDASSSSLDNLLPIILMSGGGAGMGGDLLSNPLLLLTLLDDKTSTSSNSDLLLIMTLMNSGGLGGSTDLLSSPLLLMTLLKDNSSMTDLLPILLLSGGLGGVAGTGRNAAGGVDIMSNPLILLLLLDDNNNSSLTDLLPILLMGSMQGSGMGADAGINGMLPLILLLDGNTTDTRDLLLFSLLGNGGLGGTDGAAAGGLGGILPLLLLSNSSILSGDDSLLMVLLLSGGLGGAAGGAAPDMNMLLPLIMKDSLNDTKDLLLIMMMGGLGGAGGAGGLGSMLPLLLLGNGTMDTTTLVLV